MTTINYLNQIIAMQCKINAKKCEIDRIRQLTTSISANLNTDKVQTSGSKEKMADTVALLVDLENELSDYIRLMLHKRMTIAKEIEGLDDGTESAILYMRFVNGQTFDSISDNVNYSRRQAVRIYNKALSNFERKYGAKYMNFQKMS